MIFPCSVIENIFWRCFLDFSVDVDPTQIAFPHNDKPAFNFIVFLVVLWFLMIV